MEGSVLLWGTLLSKLGMSMFRQFFGLFYNEMYKGFMVPNFLALGFLSMATVDMVAAGAFWAGVADREEEA